MIVDNKVGISILQYPQEKDQHLRTGRTAGLSLRNVQRSTFKAQHRCRIGSERTNKLKPYAVKQLASDILDNENDPHHSCDSR
uniref:Uncharacterized protein n=1 Tax=Physcomitrium patens TaxID=3218 RepID=A0A2K1IJC8_PHYPA|nr:hypothetical protein PHYPA_028071 [Physcomitrium patens]